MSQSDYPVEFVLDSLETAMAPSKQPKVILFDIGGVCVVSPLQSILNYEISKGIRPGWINYSISKTAPNGSWHKLERGEVLLDVEWFKAFNKDLRDSRRWRNFWTLSLNKEGIEVGEIPPVPEVDGEWMFWDMMSSARAPDPWMWPAVQNLKASGRYIIAALSNSIIFPPGHHYSQPGENDVWRSFDVFISSAHVGLRKPDSKIYDLTLQEVRKYAKDHAATKGKELGWVDGIKPEDVVFLDDIGENLRAAKKAGFGTIKVNLGRAYEAVEVLEELTGLKLAGDHPKISSVPKIPRPLL